MTSEEGDSRRWNALEIIYSLIQDVVNLKFDHKSEQNVKHVEQFM